MWSERPCCVLDGKPYAFNIFCMVFKSNPKSGLSFCLCMLFQTFLLLFPFMLLDTKQDVPLCTVITEQNKTRNGVSINVKRKKKHWHFWGENVCRFKESDTYSSNNLEQEATISLGFNLNLITSPREGVWVSVHMWERGIEWWISAASTEMWTLYQAVLLELHQPLRDVRLSHPRGHV